MRICLFGGTFDPIHLAHLIVAQEVQVRLGLDEVRFVPAGQPPHKPGGPAASVEHRLAMIELAIAGNPSFRLSRADVDRPGPSYTVDLIAAARAALGPEDELFFLMGLDSLLDLPTWQRPAQIASLCRLVVAARPGYHRPDWRGLEALIPEARERILLVQVPELQISATDIRRRLAAGLPIHYLVPDAVSSYIEAHELYRS